MDLLSPDSGTIFWTILTFVVLLLILKKFAWKPILETLENRENQIKEALSQAEQGQKEAEKLLEDQKQLLQKARKESAEIIDESRKSAEKSHKDIVEQAHKEAESVLERARQEITLSKETAISEIKQYAVDLSFMAAQKVIGEAITKEQHLNLIEKSIEQLSQSK